MKSLRELYRIGRGPSSSHTMAPERAAKDFLRAYPQADRYRAVLYGSFALTGSGHGTDRILREVLGKNAIVELEKLDYPTPTRMAQDKNLPVESKIFNHGGRHHKK